MRDNINIIDTSQPLLSGTKKPKPFCDPISITLTIVERRVRPSITPLANRPLSPSEIRYAIRVANYAASVLP